MPINQELQELQSFLEEDLTWRKTELTRLFMLSNSSRELLKSKSIILFLYSHWEGYIKNITKKYLLFVSNCNIRCDELTNNFSAILLKGHFQSAFESKDSLTISNQKAFLDKLDQVRLSNFTIPSSIMVEQNKKFIDSHNNLTLKNLNSILSIVDIPNISFQEEHKDYLGERLVNQRNGIGHGNKINPASNLTYLQLSDVTEIRDFTFMLMEHISDQLSYYAEKRLFLACNRDDKLQFDLVSTSSFNLSIDKFFNPENYRISTRLD